MSDKAKPAKKRHMWLYFLLTLALAVTAIVYDSANRLTVTRYERAYTSLPAGFDGFKIVQLSDLHGKQFGADNARLLDAVAAEEPDIIVLTGDFINRRAVNAQGGQAEALRVFFEKLAEIAPCFFVSGNHEWASGELDELAAILAENGINYLRNDFAVLKKHGDEIILAGVEDPNGPADMIKPDALMRNIREVYPNDFIVFLGHRDDWPTKYPDLPVDLILSGHAHGGVVRLPFIGGVFSTEYKLFPKYDAGVYNEGGYDFLLSRGLGNFNVIPRFLNPPEVVTVRLRAGIN